MRSPGRGPLGVPAAIGIVAIVAVGCDHDGVTVDGTYPNAVDDLAVESVTDTSAILVWTAPSVHGAPASRYDLRYRVGSWPADWWEGHGIHATGVPSPAVPGALERFTVSGLSAGVKHRFGIKFADGVGNWSSLSNLVDAEPDVNFRWSDRMALPTDDAVDALFATDDSLYAASNSQVWQWNGSNWEALEPIPILGETHCLVHYNGRIHAGGEYGILGYYGTRWDSLGSRNPNDTVQALHVIGSDLYVGGEFMLIGEVPARRVGRWDGSAWHALGSGVSACVRALATYRGELVAGGDFFYAGGHYAEGIARWDGSEWHPLVPTRQRWSGEAGVHCLMMYDNDLIAAGSFLRREGNVYARRIARFDGATWSPLGSGVGGYSYSAVQALAVYGGDLIVGSPFADAGGTSLRGIARWDGRHWQPMGSGFRHTTALTVYEGALIRGGSNVERWTD